MRINTDNLDEAFGYVEDSIHIQEKESMEVGRVSALEASYMKSETMLTKTIDVQAMRMITPELSYL